MRHLRSTGDTLSNLRCGPTLPNAHEQGILAVEMEAAALYAYAGSSGVPVLCLAHVTNTMAQAGDDFEKGEAAGTRDALAALEIVILALQNR
jgi:purine-nucleoside phosphorylase